MMIMLRWVQCLHVRSSGIMVQKPKYLYVEMIYNLHPEVILTFSNGPHNDALFPTSIEDNDTRKQDLMCKSSEGRSAHRP